MICLYMNSGVFSILYKMYNNNNNMHACILMRI